MTISGKSIQIKAKKHTYSMECGDSFKRFLFISMKTSIYINHLEEFVSLQQMSKWFDIEQPNLVNVFIGPWGIFSHCFFFITHEKGFFPMKNTKMRGLW